MPVVQAQPLSGTDISAITLGVIALMQLFIWHREREPGTLWLAAAFGINVVLAACNGTMLPSGPYPNLGYLLLNLVVHGCYAIGLTHYLGIRAPWRARVLALLLGPLIADGAIVAAGVPVVRIFAVLPIVYANLGFALMGVHAARREPASGHLLLALGAIVGPVFVLVAWTAGVDPLAARYYAWPVAINFGIVLLVASLMRRRQAMQRSQARAMRMSNFYAALSQTNHAMARITDVPQLYREICRICVETGHAVLAYVGVPEDGRLVPVASAGAAAGMLEGLRIDLDPSSPLGQGPASTALRAGTRQVRADMQADPGMAPFEDKTRRVGVRAQASFPLRRGGTVVAVLALYMEQPGAFDDAVVALLDEMARDVSYALDNIDREAERVQALHLAQAGLERFSRVFHSAPVSSVLLAIPGFEIVDANDAFCQRYGITRAQALGRTPASLGIGPQGEERDGFHRQVLERHHVRNVPTHVRLGSGEMRELLLNGDLIEYQDQTCILAMGLDITEMRQAAQAREAQMLAESANRAKTEFLSRMSHELRTPLNAVLGFAQLLQSEAQERLLPRDVAQLQHIEQAGWHLLTLINDVLDVSRIEAGELEVNPHGLALAPALDDALQMSEPLARQCGVCVDAAYCGRAALGVVADPLRLRQVMLNLLSNAIKYNRPGGSVRVDASREGERIRIEVQDTGLGMTREQLEHLYEPFNRLGRERGGIEGTGIGLALTRQLVRLMHGEMHVHSESGVGTRVRVWLPPLHAPLPAPASQDAPMADPPAPQGVVLYIEDNPVNVLLVARMLGRWSGVQFVHAEDGATGVELARTLRPTLVLLDMQLPDTDGHAVLRTLRADPATRDLCIVVLSAGAMHDEIQAAHRHGASDYWTKPLVFDRFLADVSRLLRRPATAGTARLHP